MKARLLIGVLTCIVMLGILVGVGSVTNAKADNPGGLTCGGSIDQSSDGYFQAGQWHISDTHYCGDGKTYAWEVQFNTSGSPNVWSDWGNDHTRISSNCPAPAGCSPNYQDSSAGCATSGSIYQYRIKWWWANGASIATAAYGRSNVCDHAILMQIP